MQAGGRIKNHVARRQFHGMRAVRILDHQFSSVILVRLSEEQRRRNVRTNAMTRPGNLPDRVVDMHPKRLASRVSVEQRRKYGCGKGGRNEERISAESTH